ncbi:MAG: hypothetical protein SGJ09_02175 [Phycisphaerae bacterium]|nr:hypothetical protein [Phycisphaerae bacterium]
MNHFPSSLPASLLTSFPKLGRWAALAAIALIAPAASADVLQVYWTIPAGHQIARVNADGSSPGGIAVSPAGDPMGVTFDEANGQMYWVTSYINGQDRIYRCSIDGTQPWEVTTVRTGLHGLGSDIEYDAVAGKLYWCAWAGQSPNGGGVYRCDLDGANEETIVTGLERPTRMVLDPANNRV